jgi:RNA 2',3'-cyclic 3'-phosphodiesterase
MAETIRTFIAVLISDELKRKMAVVQEDFKNMAPQVKWVAAENFHITVKFLGDVEAGRIEEIRASVEDAVTGIEPFDYDIGGAGAFPGGGRPRVVWIGVTQGHDQLAEIAGRLEDGLGKLGFAKEDRPFRSHITIGRLKDERGAKEISSALRESEIGRLGSVRVAGIAIMKSELRREGPIYSKLAEVALTGSGRETDNNG